jgi:hypothetical protein
MRCYCCQNILTSREACTRFKGSGTFTEMCNKCLKTIDADVVVPKREFEDDLEDLDGELDQ